jgi:hypothetical protein
MPIDNLRRDGERKARIYEAVYLKLLSKGRSAAYCNAYAHAVVEGLMAIQEGGPENILSGALARMDSGCTWEQAVESAREYAENVSEFYTANCFP